MRYSLWDTSIGSRLGRYSSEEDALAFIRTMLATYPREKLRMLSLNWRDEHGTVGEARTGDDLLDRAEEGATKPASLMAGSSSSSTATSTSEAGTRNSAMAASSAKRGGT